MYFLNIPLFIIKISLNKTNKMLDDLRIYNYHDNEPLITRETQAKNYLDEKFANIKFENDDSNIIKTIKESKEEIIEEVKNIDTDVDLSGVTDTINNAVADAKSDIIEAIEDAKPCLCNVATKEDVCKAKCAIIKHVTSSKEEIIKDVDDNFYDLNELIKNKE